MFARRGPGRGWRAFAVALLAVVLSACLPVPQVVLASEVGKGVRPTLESSLLEDDSLIRTYVASNLADTGVALGIQTPDGQVLTEYFGSRDATGAEVDSETVFEWGRVSDMLVWISLMQLSDQGSLQLSAQVQSFDGISDVIPTGYGSATLLDLMNHTSGIDVATISGRSILPEGSSSAFDGFAFYDLASFREPGELVSYTAIDSLIGAAVVESVTGIPFADYVEKNIFEPLGMTSTSLVVGGTPEAVARSKGKPDFTLAAGSASAISRNAPLGAQSAFTCIGTLDDLLTLAGYMLGTSDGDDSGMTPPRDLWQVTRYYPGTDVPRLSYGLLAFPQVDGIWGLDSTTWSGYSCCLYMDPVNRTAVAVMANSGDALDSVEGFVRLMVGRNGITFLPDPSVRAWDGYYQEATQAAHGPHKLIAALSRIKVDVSADGSVSIGGASASSLGYGTYTVQSSSDQDLYRFHVNASAGAEFSRTSSDYYLVPVGTWTLEFVLGGLAVGAVLYCLGYTVVGLWTHMRARFRHERWKGQFTVLVLAVLSLAAVGAAAVMLAQLWSGALPSSIVPWRWLEAIYVLLTCIGVIWLVVTRWRGSAYSKASLVATVLITVSVVVIIMNLAYWELMTW